MQVTIDLPDQLARRLEAQRAKLEENNKNDKDEAKKRNNGAQDKEGSDAGDAHDKPDSFLTITHGLDELTGAHKIDEEFSEFICSGHEYMKIPHQSELEEAEKKPFDANMKVTRE